MRKYIRKANKRKEVKKFVDSIAEVFVVSFFKKNILVIFLILLIIIDFFLFCRKYITS
jgi:hypothetical protein